MIDKNDLDGVKDFLYYKDVKDDIYAYANGEIELAKADTTRFGYYDDHFKWLRSEVTGFSGIPNMGKSAFVTFLSALKMYHDKWKVAIYSPESNPPEFFYANYLHSLSSKHIFLLKKKPSVEYLKQYENILENQLFLCNPEKMPTFKGIMERFQKAYEYHGCDMFIIDPFNCLEREWEHSNRDDRYVGDFIDHYKDFAIRNNVVATVVMHPKGSVRLVKNSVDYEMPSAYDLAGGAMWYNKLDNLIFVHRPHMISNPEDVTVTIRHSKIKKKQVVGKGGDATIEYYFTRGRYGYMGFEPDFTNVEGLDIPHPIVNNSDFDNKQRQANDFDNEIPF